MWKNYKRFVRKSNERRQILWKEDIVIQCLSKQNENIVGQMRKVKVNDFNLSTFGALSQIKKLAQSSSLKCQKLVK